MMATAPKPPRTKATSLRMTAAMAEKYVSAYTAIYGPRGAARWVEEALGQLLKHPSFVTKIGAGEVNQEFEASRYIGLTPLSQAQLEDAIRRYRRVDLLVEGLPSMILRAAIRLRLETEQTTPSQVVVTPQAEISPGKLRRRKQ
ncbi:MULTISPECIES: hypothetical protein [Xanthomonas]|uniref:Uncharacterized protein n=6 Tax=Xanthomonas TaxID=338 RepID=A0A6V7FJT3_9XANT|nr:MULTISPECIES: hypothetical protein [Xanthomonas]EGD10756.1 hypothetical protein XVE_0811 [Xanthomonas vesicatoria ATCC 35937]MBD1532355.1 hypothetical protein [Xanthomonas citri pv. citri]MBD4081542.1 hypothetical protein [Xanthomonas citri pv. citri]MBD4389097.1 hypothetical protein [Xanthomonas citri pv. citri]MBD4392311.1 hypothetical protein [Xanthomonas citri pv. citri]